jgi:hypothetical protein
MIIEAGGPLEHSIGGDARQMVARRQRLAKAFGPDSAGPFTSERLTKRDPRQPVATEQRLPKAIGPDSASARGSVAS